MESSLIIRPAEAADIPWLEAVLGDTPQGKHRERQAGPHAGTLTYLLAWWDRQPAGHVLVCWDGRLPGTTSLGCPAIEDLFVREDLRRRGIGTRLLADAELLVQAHGFGRVSLAVGLLPQHEPARRLYLQRGYRHAGFSPSYQGWWTHDTRGTPVWWEEAVEYLVHDLSGT